jgi:uncharacterized membrane protein
MPEPVSRSAEQLAALPIKKGFRLRGMEMTRLETFTDAAFAFAVTLLVIGGSDSVPANFDEMLLALDQVPAFAASFANIMLFWYAHHIWSRRFGLDDTPSILLSLLLIFVVLIYVYPLKAIYSGAIEFFSHGYFASYFGFRSLADLRDLFVIFGVGFAGLSAIIVLLNAHAYSARDKLSLNELELFDLQTEKTHWNINVIVAVISVFLAILLPGRWVVVAGMFYGVFAIVLPWHAISRGRLRDKLHPQ